MPDTRYAIVVEDNATVLLDTVEMLEEAGFSVFASMDTDGALRRLGDYGDHLALLFTNVELPGALNGFGLARFVAERWPGVPIIVASGRRIPHGDDLPTASRFLSKPYTAHDVLDALAHLGLMVPAG